MAGRTRPELHQIGTSDSRFVNHAQEVSWISQRLGALDGMIEADVTFSYNANGDITTETITDLTGKVIKLTEFTYRLDGNVDKETITKDGIKIQKTYLYDAAGTITGVRQRII